MPDDLTLPENNDLIPVDDGEGFTPEGLENDLIPDRPVVESSEPDILRKLQDNPSFSVGRFVVSKKFNHDGGEDRIRVLDAEMDEEAEFPLSDLKGVRDETGLKKIFDEV
ncbi:MAG: hypothetical protein PHV55_08225 [Candidatus Omnitrophica bacterium]|nr:hypothetical protein [Candidatus Omnitrophota bacterium]